MTSCVNGNVNVWNIQAVASKYNKYNKEDKSNNDQPKEKNMKELEHFIQDKKKFSYHAVAYDPEFDF